jgi:AraC-like DNA-binding protein
VRRCSRRPFHGRDDRSALVLAPYRWTTLRVGDTLDGMAVVNESVGWRPPPRLAPYLDVGYGYRQSGATPGSHRGLPSPCLTLVVTLDDGLHIARHSNPCQSPGSYDAVVGGLHSAPMLLTHDGHQAGIQLSLTALGSRALFGAPAAALADIDAHAVDVLGPTATLLRERLLNQPTWRGRFDVLEGWLDAQLRDDVAMSPEVAEAWRLVRMSRGATPIARISEAVGWSARHLRSQFAAEIGLTPKAASRVVRFDRARRVLQRRHLASAAPDLAGLAASCGYADQAHLAREFRDHAGCSATDWLRTEFPVVQFPNVQATDPMVARESAV